ncbi:serine-type D-Ala-D-Ala carboxypeptidase [Alkalilimnicola ehrlichii]|uniref:serine-type D-Ala-D-Ala carboxypeptidase n=1 Tax=Alkalilimnicola ehrlichii TaxID=351052 RepID=A0A3E0X1T8_9GAMM|nr:D-alanyl-D-alanine carboxypeptidase family protein [Alkalilimnicola ehrlichii]RFA31280.1 serine-type D-Ala-D-Ala carboxypeptidase [Alkalilimnicola ehrlichii]RFA39447.1 serine-type D-Ala-D-Ala carboxypeptidase [Alkalilimnicola ehrlichii]
MATWTKSSRFIASLVLVGLYLVAGAVQASIPLPAPPSLSANSYILLDFHSGRELVTHNADERVDPASLTKIMTAYVVFNELKSGNITLDERVTISERAWRAPGSRMFVEVGTQVSVENLLKGLIIQSGNDASIALAEHIAGNEDTFAQVMNQYAARLGMDNTNYRNATGLPHEDHYTTARDVAILAKAAIRDFPEYYAWYSERQFTWNGISQRNRNQLLWRDDSVDGMKTGHTSAAGYCLATSAMRDNMRLVSVVMGASSERARADQSHALLNYGFRFFETHRLYEANNALTETRVWRGAADGLPLGLNQDLYVTIPRRQYDNLRASMSVDSQIVAPVTAGSPLGHVVIRLGDEIVREEPLFALDSVDEGGFWRRMMDDVRLLFH